MFNLNIKQVLAAFTLIRLFVYQRCFLCLLLNSVWFVLDCIVEATNKQTNKVSHVYLKNLQNNIRSLVLLIYFFKIRCREYFNSTDQLLFIWSISSVRSNLTHERHKLLPLLIIFLIFNARQNNLSRKKNHHPK